MRIARPITHTVVRPLTDPLVGSASFTPAQLFKSGEQGAWYDPSDFSTMFQDSAGSTPVTAVEQPVGKILDKSGRGNHASQPTSAARPVLSARKNLLRKTEDFSSADWIKIEVSVSMAGAVATITPSTTNGTQRVINNAGAVNGTQTVSIEVKPAGYSKVALKESNTTGQHASFDLTGAGSVLSMSAANATIALLPDGYYRLSMTVIIIGIVGRQLNILAPAYTSGDPNNSIFAGDGTSGVLVRYPQCEFGVSATRYQRVNTATDYDTVGFPYYLAFDGVDDYLRTTFPNLGSNVTIGRSIPGTGASILTGQTIGAGNWDDSTSHCALVVIDRALTGPETTLLTEYLNTRAGL